MRIDQQLNREKRIILKMESPYQEDSILNLLLSIDGRRQVKIAFEKAGLFEESQSQYISIAQYSELQEQVKELKNKIQDVENKDITTPTEPEPEPGNGGESSGKGDNGLVFIPEYQKLLDLEKK